ncbi:hypothetical protein ACHAXR_002569 [Thalassiosira sp. AJA248-18]
MSGTKRNLSPSKSLTNGEDSSLENNASPPTKKLTAISNGNDAATASSSQSSSGAKKKNDDDRTSKDYYFDSYSHHGIHEEMLKDEVRTRTYQMAILNNKHLFEGKIVLDVGCGTGILSMFAVQAGASHVYAVDCSSIIEQASRIVKDNGMADKITLIQGKMEEIELPVPQVDIIVSEWMGYFLLYESMLNTVLYARDKWLKPDDGIVFPDKAVMYLCAVEDEQMKYERIEFWENVYGFDMSALKEVALKEPVVDVVDPKLVVTNSVPILNIDLQKCTEEDLSFTSPFRLRAQRKDCIHSFVAYFECAFTRVHKPVGFSTSPFSKYTHWKQTIFYLKDRISICEGEEVTGQISCKPNPNNERDLDIALDINFDGMHSKIIDKRVEYRLR